VLTAEEKKKLQVMRVQIQLNLLGLYSGPMDGIFSKETRDSLMQFQAVKSLPASGMMTTDTLNVLGVPAVN
jgi:His-Xaa-Ser repeat protein HxsA